MQLYSVYSSKLCYQLTTDVSDSAVRVRHSQQEPRGMNKLRAGNDRKCILQWMKRGREKLRVQKSFSVTHAHATNALQSSMRMNQDTYLDEYFS